MKQGQYVLRYRIAGDDIGVVDPVLHTFVPQPSGSATTVAVAWSLVIALMQGLGCHMCHSVSMRYTLYRHVMRSPRLQHGLW